MLSTVHRRSFSGFQKNGNWGSSMASCSTLVMDTVWFMLFRMRFWAGRLKVGFALFRLIVCQPVFIEGVSIRKQRIYLRLECSLERRSQREDGGFYRIRKMENPAYMPTQLEVRNKKLRIRFSDQLPQSGSFAVSTWSLKRTRSYGSKHYHTKKLDITNYKLHEDWIWNLRFRILSLHRVWKLSCKFRKRYRDGSYTTVFIR